ncbi:MAG: ABC transporter permease [Bacteroidetes bacterium]|nr:ABC transporter permease [Bacteroidota bacterium]
MNLELKIAKRYLFSKKSTNAINIISLISGLAMLFGTMALILVLSVFNGLEGLIKSLYTVFYADVSISANEGKSFEITHELRQKLNAVSYIDAYSFVLEENALLEYNDKQFICTIKGVDENYFKVIPKFDTFMVDGKKILQRDSIPFAIVGIGVALKLGLNASQSFIPLTIYMPKKTSSSFATMENAFNKSYINTSGAFAVSDEFDSKYTIVPFRYFQQLTENDNRASEIVIRLKNTHQTNNAITQLKQTLGKDFSVKSRYEQNEVLYKILKSEKWITFAILLFIMIIASFNIIGALSMLVLEKKKDIATLTALGLQRKSILKIFMLEGMLMSCLGAAIGMILALILCILQDKVGIIPMPGTSFLVSYYPVKMEITDFIAVAFVVIIISLLAAYLPAKKAGNAVENEYLNYLS